MNQMLGSLADRLEAFLVEEREEALRALGQRLAEIEAAKLAALRRISMRGSSRPAVDGEEMFRGLRRKYAP